MNDVLERLIVVGLEWTKDAEQTADEVADLPGRSARFTRIGVCAAGYSNQQYRG